MTNLPELKPCPFCGGKAALFVDGGIRVLCLKCYARTRELKDGIIGEKLCGNATKSVIEAWNKRANDGSGTNAEPVKHGRWIRFDDIKCRCSECEVITLIAQYPHGNENYCPNCGAKMDGGTEND